MVIADNCISDHISDMFNIDLPAVISNNRSVDCYFRPVNEITAKRFAEAYEASPGPAIIEASGSPLDIEDLTALFNSVCLDIIRGGQSTQLHYLSESTDTAGQILLHYK